MKSSFRALVLAACLLPALGCAGGWRNGVPPEGAAAPAAAPLASASTKAVPANAGPATGTVATVDGALFVFKGTANSVSVAGEFNSWNTSADPLTKAADGTWSLKKKLSPGRYLYKFVLDGGTWKEDASAKESADDGYGGKNSVLVVGGAAAPAAPKPAAPMATAAGAAPVVTADGVVFRYSGPGNSVNLAGEFNSWSTSADPLTKQADGTWTITKPLAAGKYPYKFVIDGGTWKEDPSAQESVDDGFGGKNSIVTVGGTAGAAASAPAAAASAAAPKAVTGKAQAPQVTAAGVRFTFAGSARSVSLCGAFNQWAPNADPMQQQSDGTWTITKKLPAGAHAYKFLVDGAQWKTDDANPSAADDGFGGKNSVVTVK